VVARVGERLAGSKQETQKFDVEIFNFRKLTEMEIRKEHQIEISNRFAATENVHNSKNVNTVRKELKRISKPQLKRV
jgi:hypothetical protein